MAAAASDRAEVDTARPFRSVKEAVAVFGDRIIVGGEGGHSRHSSSSTAIANATSNAAATPSAKHKASSSSSTMTFSPPNPTAEIEAAEIMPATTVPTMYSAPSSPASLTSSSPLPTTNPRISECGDGDGDEAAGLVVMRSIEKLEADVAETRQEVAALRKRGSEMEMAVASLNAQLHRGLSRLAEMEADRARAAVRRRSVGGDTDAASSATLLRWGDKLAASGEYLPSFSHALSLGEMDGDDAAELVGGGRRRKAQKVKPIVPLIGDIIFAKRKSTSTKEKGDERFYSGDLYSVIG